MGCVPKWTKGTDCKSVIRRFESDRSLWGGIGARGIATRFSVWRGGFFGAPCWDARHAPRARQRFCRRRFRKTRERKGRVARAVGNSSAVVISTSDPLSDIAALRAGLHVWYAKCAPRD